ncbi:MAG: lipoyl(octanoyl) transferase LipB [Deltaproteobacteria bacterium]|nr:lipoyl(octanoyl) transferase LipB [Deltaproteobacteria bacterium]
MQPFPGLETLSPDVIYYGVLPYDDALELQAYMGKLRRRNRITDTLLLLEHPPTYTLGIRGEKTHLLVSEDELKKRGIKLFRTDRGGDITFHGPGQIIGYPIIDVGARFDGVRLYVRWLEKMLIRALADLGVHASGLPGYPGAWTENRKIAAIGVKVDSGGISSHGFAVNINTDLHYFDDIVPCGLENCFVTSLSRELGRKVPMADARDALSRAFIHATNL